MNAFANEAPKINAIPFGLLDLLEIKNRGQYPQQLGAELVPTFGLRELYEVNNAEFLQTNQTVTGSPSGTEFVTHIVPQDEIWSILTWSAISDPLGAGDSSELYLFKRWNFNFTPSIVLAHTSGVQVSPHVAEVHLVGAGYGSGGGSGGLYVRPGTNLGVGLIQSVGTYAVRSLIEFCRYRV